MSYHAISNECCDQRQDAWVSTQAGGRRGLSPSPAVFTLEEKFPVHLMVATVTGIAPFVSMLRHAIHRGERRFRFVVPERASYQDEFAYRKELEAASARHPELLAYISTVSRPGEERNRGWAAPRAASTPWSRSTSSASGSRQGRRRPMPAGIRA